MKQVVIDNKNGVVLVNGKQIPYALLSVIRGAVGKRFVVRHYKEGKIVEAKYPDMSKVVTTEKQRARRDLFREAVVYAQWILADEERKKAFQKTLPEEKQQKVYLAAIQLYMRMQGNKQWLRKQLAVKAVVQETVSNRQLAMGNKHIDVNGKLSVVNGYQGVWQVLWAKRKDTGWQVVERRHGLLDCMAEVAESDFDVGGTTINALKFYFEQVLGRRREFYDLPRPKKPRKPPDILAEKEVMCLIKKTENLKHRALLMTAYSSGLRVSELVSLRIRDIDSKRMMIHIRQGKGGKDRMVQLSQILLRTL